jgi:carboxylesterase
MEPMPVLPGAEPFRHAGSTEVGVLLCHGFTGTPASMRPWGEHLAAEGLTVSGPRLPGHGTTWQECNHTRWQDWLGVVRSELNLLRRRCSTVFMFGQSMGGTLTLRAAQELGDQLAGIVLVNPSVLTLRREVKALARVPLVTRVVGSAPGLGGDIAKPGVSELSYPRVPLRALLSLTELWRLVVADLAKVTQPLLLARSAVDHVVEPENARAILEGVSSADVTELELRDSYHVATLDHDAGTIFDGSLAFVREHSRSGEGTNR